MRLFPVRQLIAGAGLVKDQSRGPVRAVQPVVSPWTRAGSVPAGAMGSRWAGARSAVRWIPLFGRCILEYVHLVFSALSCCQH